MIDWDQPIRTTCGRPAELIRTLRTYYRPRVVVITDDSGNEHLERFNDDGLDLTPPAMVPAIWTRWEIENAFHVLTMTLRCESSSNCFPGCALFQFCMAMFAYNARQVLLAALYAEHAQEDVEQMSQYQVSLDIVQPMDGMETAITDDEWRQLTPRSVRGIAKFLCQTSQHVPVKSYRKSVRGPKKPKPKRKRCKTGTHVATHRLLQQRKQPR